MERIEGDGERWKFAEFIRNLPELDVNIRFIFCGIMHDIDRGLSRILLRDVSSKPLNNIA